MRAYLVVCAAMVVVACGSVRNNPDAGPGDAAGDATTSVCGDGMREAAEECDDGNLTPGDGCDATCRLDHACLLTHDGGSPAKISSLNLAPSGQFTQLRTLTLGDNDSAPASDPRGFAAITVCGRHVYAAMDASNVIAHLELDAGGALTARASTPLTDIHSLVCDDTRPILLAFTGARTIAATTVTSFSIDANGDLAMKDTLPVVFGGGGNTLSSLLVVRHPTTKDVWIVGYTSSLGGPGGGASSYRVTVADDASLTSTQGPADIGGSDFGNQIAIRPDGALMVMAGFSGGCTGAWRLPATRALPTAADQIVACSGNFSNGNHIAVRPTSTFFYHSTGAGALRVGSVDLAAGTLVDHGTTTIGTGDLHLALAYAGSLLLSVDATTGTTTAYKIESNETTLTRVGSQTVPAGSIRGVTVARCGL